jgi:hypothetical protein
MKYVKFIVTTVLLLGSLLLLSSLETPANGAKHSFYRSSRKFCGVQFGVDNQAVGICTLTVARLSPTTSGTGLMYNLSFANGQSALFAFDHIGLQSTITVKGNITGSWMSVSAIRASDGAVLATYPNTGSGTTYALFGIPNTCDDIYLTIY